MTFAVILMFILMVATALVLVVGISAMTIGGEFNKKYSNKLMAARVYLQAATLIMLAVVIYTQ